MIRESREADSGLHPMVAQALLGLTFVALGIGALVLTALLIRSAVVWFKEMMRP